MTDRLCSAMLVAVMSEAANPCGHPPGIVWDLWGLAWDGLVSLSLLLRRKCLGPLQSLEVLLVLVRSCLSFLLCSEYRLMLLGARSLIHF